MTTLTTVQARCILRASISRPQKCLRLRSLSFGSRLLFYLIFQFRESFSRFVELTSLIRDLFSKITVLSDKISVLLRIFVPLPRQISVLAVEIGPKRKQ